MNIGVFVCAYRPLGRPTHVPLLHSSVFYLNFTSEKIGGVVFCLFLAAWLHIASNCIGDKKPKPELEKNFNSLNNLKKYITKGLWIPWCNACLACMRPYVPQAI